MCYSVIVNLPFTNLYYICTCVAVVVLRWRELCGMKEARKNHGLVVVNNRIYAVGGQGALGNNTNIATTITEDG